MFIFPELGMGMLAYGIGETGGMDHRQPFHIRATMIARFAVSLRLRASDEVITAILAVFPDAWLSR